MIILDRIVYSYDDGRNASSPGKIAGIVVGALAGVGLLGTAIFFYFFRYRRRKRGPSSQRPVFIDPDNEDDDDHNPIQYPTVVPYTASHSRDSSASHPPSHSRHGSSGPGSPTTPTSPGSGRTSKRNQRRGPQARPSQASISLPYSADQVDIYDPYGRLSTAPSGSGTASETAAATSTLYAAASMSSGGSTTIGSDNPPAYESIPLMTRKSDQKEKRGSTEKRPR